MKEFEVQIVFCMQWNYAPKAAGLAEQLFTHFRSQITQLKLTAGTGGVFEVFINNEQIYSKKETGVFPKSEMITEQIMQMQ